MYDQMLIPLDGSETAEKVLPYARYLGSKLRLPIELLGVIVIESLASLIPASKALELDNMVVEESRRMESYLEQIARTFHPLNARIAVEKGNPAEIIIDKAAVNQTNMIAMATHGRSGLDRWLMGSIAEKVLRGTRNPVLLVRAKANDKCGGERSFRSVIVPLDGSEVAESVLPAITELAKKLKVGIVLVRAFHVPPAIYAGGEGYYAINYEAVRDQLKDEARSYLERKVDELRRQGIESVSFTTPEGLGADEIIALGRKTGESLIAMSSHGRSGVKRWVLGSVAETVVRHSDEPVLVYRAEQGSFTA
jgi:nucleotide-binding universal stress UspA family protein